MKIFTKERISILTSIIIIILALIMCFIPRNSNYFNLIAIIMGIVYIIQIFVNYLIRREEF